MVGLFNYRKLHRQFVTYFCYFCCFYHFLSFLSKPVKKCEILVENPSFWTTFRTPFWTPMGRNCPLFLLDDPLPPNPTQPLFKEIWTLTPHEVYMVCRLALEIWSTPILGCTRFGVQKNQGFWQKDTIPRIKMGLFQKSIGIPERIGFWDPLFVSFKGGFPTKPGPGVVPGLSRDNPRTRFCRKTPFKWDK